MAARMKLLLLLTGVKRGCGIKERIGTLQAGGGGCGRRGCQQELSLTLLLLLLLVVVVVKLLLVLLMLVVDFGELVDESGG